LVANINIYVFNILFFTTVKSLILTSKLWVSKSETDSTSYNIFFLLHGYWMCSERVSGFVIIMLRTF